MNIRAHGIRLRWLAGGAGRFSLVAAVAIAALLPLILAGCKGRTTKEALEGEALRQEFLEMINVSVVEELINMIVSQRSYEINSKAITTSDEMMQSATQLKR